MSCPFLKTVTTSTIPKQIIRLMSFVKRCPVASEMIKQEPQFTNSSELSNEPINVKEEKLCRKKICPLQQKTIVDKTVEVSAKSSFSINEKKDFKNYFDDLILAKKKDSTYRTFRRVLRDADNFPYAHEYIGDRKNKIVMWCSNDYLGMSWHPAVREKAYEAIRKYGVGSGGTRNISGNTLFHEELEAELADLHGKDAALLFTSCFVANEAALYTLGTKIPNLTFFSDAGNHASMIHGIRTTKAQKEIFHHNDYLHLDKKMSKYPKSTPKLVAFETVHSMTGKISPLKEFLDVCDKYNALSFVDEVHAVGLYGPEGAGVAEERNLMKRIDMITGTLGKAYASVGGYIAGDSSTVDMLRSYAAGFIFTTSLPPPVLAAALASVRLLRSLEGRQLRQLHQERVASVRQKLIAAGLPILECSSHIIPVHVGQSAVCTKLSQDLMNHHNIYVQSINPPTVAKGEERLRIAPSPHHTEDMEDHLVESLVNVWKKNSLALNRMGSDYFS